MWGEGGGGGGVGKRLGSVFRAFRQQVQSGNRRANIVTRFGQLSGKGRTEGRVSAILLPHIGDLICEQRGVSWRQSCDGGFTGTGHAGEQERPSVAHRAGRVHKEASLL